MPGQKKNVNGLEVTGNAYVKLHYDLIFNLNGWLPSKKPYINIDTILLIVTTMSVIRGGTRQSVSAFRMASVASTLYVITTCPVIVGNMATMQDAKLWPWENQHDCHDYFKGKPFLFPNDAQSNSLCASTQLAIFGSLVVFIAMNFNIFACLRVFVYNKNRQSLSEGDVADNMYDPIFRGNPSSGNMVNNLNEPLNQHESGNFFGGGGKQFSNPPVSQV